MSSILSQVFEPQFWIAVVQIIWVDLVLSGDNAVLIAMACRDLPARQRRWAMVIGAATAAALLIVFTITVSTVIMLPYLRLIAACALLWIAINLLGTDQTNKNDRPQQVEGLWRAVRTIVIADVIMGLDNSVAVAAIANGRYVLLGLGLAISIPIVVAGSAVVSALIERFPIIVWAGGAVLGWVAGQLFASDPAIKAYMNAFELGGIGMNSPLLQMANHLADQIGLNLVELGSGLLGAAFVVLAGAAVRRASADALH